MKSTMQFFGKLPDGKEVSLYTLSNRKGMEMQVINYGGAIVSLKAPDKNGNFADVVLGFDSVASYRKEHYYLGAIVGRCANRIADGKFVLDGREYQLTRNNEGNHLHGGYDGFDRVYWDIEELTLENNASLKLSYDSPDGEEGYPGNVHIEVIYTLTDDNELKIRYSASTDQKTIFNITQHSYFNLSGNLNQDILDHELTLNADRFTPVNERLLPTGEFRNVEGTPFDFRTPHVIGERIYSNDIQVTYGGGYDHCFVLNRKTRQEEWAASLYERGSGRLLEVFTTEPGLQVYSGNFLNGSHIGKGGIAYHKRFGICLEAAHFADSPNKPHFPSVVLKPGVPFESSTTYKFSVKKPE
jgi:aldose 1-epimerase